MPQQPGPDGMSVGERKDLAQVARARAKLAKQTARRLAAERAAEFEQQIATIYEADNALWQHVVDAANETVKAANAELRRICQEEGIPKEFAPSVFMSFYGRNENYSNERRTELRRVATTAIEAMEQRAIEAIEEKSVAVQEQLLAGGLSSRAAQAFLATIPTPEALMPPLDARSLEAALPGHLRLLGETTENGADDEGADDGV